VGKALSIKLYVARIWGTTVLGGRVRPVKKSSLCGRRLTPSTPDYTSGSPKKKWGRSGEERDARHSTIWNINRNCRNG